MLFSLTSLYTVVVGFVIGFIFLPDFAKFFNVTLSQQTKAGAILRLLSNIRFKTIALLRFGKPLYTLEVSKIFVFPIKSCSYIQPNEWEIDEHGFKHDRQYMLAFWEPKKQIYEAYTLRNATRLSLVKIDYNLKENYFEFIYPVIDMEGKTVGEKSFRLPCNVTPEFIAQKRNDDSDHETNLWDVHFSSIDIGKALPDEFKISMQLNRPGSTLLYASKPKSVKTGHPSGILKSFRTTYFQDYYPMKFLADEDIDTLNSKIVSKGLDFKAKALHFRPNLVVKGLKLPYQSLDNWYRFRMETDTGYHYWNATEKCPRCSVPNMKLDEGVMDKKMAVSKTLSSYRKVDSGDKHLHFLGMYAINLDEGYTVKVGDKVTLLEEKVQPYVGPK